MKLLEKSKLAYQTYNFFQKSKLVYNLPIYKKYGIKKSYHSPVSSEDFKHLTGELNYLDAGNSKELLPKEEAFQNLSPQRQEEIINWSENGYAVLKQFLSEDKVKEVNDNIDQLVSSGKVKRQKDTRILFAMHHSELIKSIGNDPELKSILELLLGRKVDLFQSLNFENGSQQRAHSDSIHMSTFPDGNIIAVWIALEDITLECGPLHYYPGSHKLPYVHNRDYGNVGTKFSLGNKTYGDYEDKIAEVIAKNDLKKEVLLAKKGDLLIWHANLLHGGEPILQKGLTRKSMVFHYYAQDVICYHEITQRPTLKR